MRLRKYVRVIPVPDVVSSQSDSQNDDQIIVAQDNLYAITQSQETNFGDTPFDNVNNGEQTPKGSTTNVDSPDNDVTNITVLPPTLQEVETETVTTRQLEDTSPNSREEIVCNPDWTPISEPEHEGTDSKKISYL